MTRGRPRKGETRPTTTLGAAVAAALQARRAAMANGPRTLADLARALGVSPQQLHHALTGARGTPTEAQIRAALPEMG